MDIRTFNIESIRRKYGERLLEKLHQCKVSEGPLSIDVDIDSECGKAIKAECDARRKGTWGKVPEEPATGFKRLVKGAMGLARSAVNRTLRRNDPAYQSMIAARKTICQVCPHANKNTLGVFAGCSICKCTFWGKLADPDQQCPDRPARWAKVELPVI